MSDVDGYEWGLWEDAGARVLMLMAVMVLLVWKARCVCVLFETIRALNRESF